MNATLIFVLVLVVLLFWLISVYNDLIAKRNQVKNIRSGVFTQLKKRYDLIPNLVSTVKEYLTHEREVLTRVTELRSRAMNANSDKETFDLNSKISKLLGNIQVAIEAYPTLQANENIMHLQATLTEIEEQISAARRAYNSSVMVYNNTIEMFPSNIIANLFKFQKDAFFEMEEDQKSSPNVSELFKQ